MDPGYRGALKPTGGSSAWHKRRPLELRETLVSYAFLLPALAFFGVFVVYPILVGVFTSFFDYTMRKFDFVGLDNYIRLFGDKIFLKSMKNTILLVAGAVPMVVIFSVFISSTIYQKSPLVRSLFRGVFYLPVVTGTVSVTVVWKWIFDPFSGVLNWVLQSAGLTDQPIMWLGDRRYALWAILAVLFTTSIGQPVVLYTAALGNLDKSQIEAAEIDGASDWQVFRYVKWPGMMPTTLYVAVITTINSFQCFSLIQLLTSGGPNYNTSTVMYLLYERAFKLMQFGYANAMGVVLAVVIGIISILQFRVFGSNVEY
ncbi:MAG: sugar ABC transporter permease [Clostridia bacterium]|nr:sugar ABC transporter permease [Clostridia bacterium]